MIDNYIFEEDNSSALNGFLVNPSDTNELPAVTRAIYIGTAGDIKLILKKDSEAIILKNVPSGALLPLRVVKIFAGKTTAEDIVGLF